MCFAVDDIAEIYIKKNSKNKNKNKKSYYKVAVESIRNSYLHR